MRAFLSSLMSLRVRKAAFLLGGASLILFMAFSGGDWRTASRESTGLAPLPKEVSEAVVQVDCDQRKECFFIYNLSGYGMAAAL